MNAEEQKIEYSIPIFCVIRGAFIGNEIQLCVDANDVLLTVRAKPNGRTNEIGEVRHGALTICVTAAPEDGKANGAIIALLSKCWKIARTRITMERGRASCGKIVRFASMNTAQLHELLPLFSSFEISS